MPVAMRRSSADPVVVNASLPLLGCRITVFALGSAKTRRLPPGVKLKIVPAEVVLNVPLP